MVSFAEGATSPSAKTILLWDWRALPKRVAWLLDFQRTSRRGEWPACGRQPLACRVTSNRSLVPLQDFDAVVFLMDLRQAPRPPVQRSPHQRFVYFTTNAPPNVRVPFAMRHVFNWTMTYRLDSDVPFSPGEVVPRGRGPGQQRKEGWLQPPATAPSYADVLDSSLQTMSMGILYWTTAPKHERMVATVFSDCQSRGWRMQVVDRLAEYTAVDVFRNCRRTTPTRDTLPENLLKKYKFYLVFEESFCRDYVSWEFFNVLKYYVVPVVLGGANYSALAPPLSYIDARDFQSLYHLAEYLKYLSNHRSEYSKFFWWKAYYSVKTEFSLCRLCEKLHESREPKTYADLEEWWKETDSCNVSKPLFFELETNSHPTY